LRPSSKYSVGLDQIFPSRTEPRRESPTLCLDCTSCLKKTSHLYRKPGNCVFSLKCCMLFHQKTRNTIKNITWSELNHPSLSKRSSGSTRQDLGRERSMLTHMLCVSQVCHAVSRCVKDGVVLRQAWSKSQWAVLIGYLTIPEQMLDAIKHTQMTIFSFRKIAHRCIVCVTQSN